MLRCGIKIVSKVNKIYLSQTLLIKRSAGHSKWQNIRHIKGEKDAQKSKLFSKMGTSIKVAVAEGGSNDPKLNVKLAQVVEQCRRSNMPVATIQSIIKSCQTDKSQSKRQVLEIIGPGSCFILCEIFTDKPNIIRQNLVGILKKYKAKLTDGAKHYFEEKGIIESEPPTSAPKTETELQDYATEHAIESGAEDIKIIDDKLIEFYCGTTSVNKVMEELEKLGYKINSASVEFIPFKLQELEDADLDICGKLYQKLEAIPEVVRLADNIA